MHRSGMAQPEHQQGFQISRFRILLNPQPQLFGVDPKPLPERQLCYFEERLATSSTGCLIANKEAYTVLKQWMSLNL